MYYMSVLAAVSCRSGKTLLILWQSFWQEDIEEIRTLKALQGQLWETNTSFWMSPACVTANLSYMMKTTHLFASYIHTNSSHSCRSLFQSRTAQTTIEIILILFFKFIGCQSMHCHPCPHNQALNSVKYFNKDRIFFLYKRVQHWTITEHHTAKFWTTKAKKFDHIYVSFLIQLPSTTCQSAKMLRVSGRQFGVLNYCAVSVLINVCVWIF